MYSSNKKKTVNKLNSLKNTSKNAFLSSLLLSHHGFESTLRNAPCTVRAPLLAHRLTVAVLRVRVTLDPVSCDAYSHKPLINLSLSQN